MTDNKLHKALGVITRPIFAIIVGLLLGAVIILAGGSDPIEAFKLMFDGSVGTSSALAETVVKTASLTFAGLAYAFAYRCGLLNIGVESQLLAGGICSAWVGINVTGLPAIVHIPLALLAGMLGGAILGGLVAFLKTRFRASEVITTVMFNYILFILVDYLVTGPMREKGNFPQSATIRETAELPVIVHGTRINIGIILAVIAVIIYGFFWAKSKQGFEMRVVGLSPTVAKAIGINVTKNAIMSMMVSGALGGLVGSMEILGIQKRLLQGFSPGYGFDGIAVALLGNNNPVGIFFSAFLFGSLKTGGNNVQMFSNVPSAVVMIIQGLIIVTMTINLLRFNSKKRLGE